MTAKSEWLAALNNAKSQGLVPTNVPIATVNSTGWTIYPNGMDPKGADVCSATYFCRGTDGVSFV